VGDNVFSEFKGAFSENYVLTQLITNKDVYVAYYAKNNSTMELDFVVQSGANIYPVEVKAEQNVKSKSLRNFVTIDNAGSGMRGYRLSMRGFIHQDWLTNVPLCAAANVF
jgi:predicted AAA+ superfamily ATPase